MSPHKNYSYYLNWVSSGLSGPNNTMVSLHDEWGIIKRN